MTTLFGAWNSFIAISPVASSAVLVRDVLDASNAVWSLSVADSIMQVSVLDALLFSEVVLVAESAVIQW